MIYIVFLICMAVFVIVFQWMYKKSNKLERPRGSYINAGSLELLGKKNQEITELKSEFKNLKGYSEFRIKELKKENAEMNDMLEIAKSDIIHSLNLSNDRKEPSDI